MLVEHNHIAELRLVHLNFRFSPVFLFKIMHKYYNRVYKHSSEAAGFSESYMCFYTHLRVNSVGSSLLIKYFVR